MKKSLLAALCLIATPAFAGLLVTEVTGNVRFGDRVPTQRVTTLMEIRDGWQLSVAAGSKLVVVDLASGSEFELGAPGNGEARYVAGASGPQTAAGEAVPARALPEKNLPSVRIAAGKSSQASFVMRSMMPPKRGEALPQAIDDERGAARARADGSSLPPPETSGVLSLLTPDDDETILERPTLHWAYHNEANRYRVWVSQPGKSSGWSTVTDSTSIALPEAHPLVPGATYSWRVEALRNNRVLRRVTGSFSVATKELQAMLAHLKPEADAPFARRVLYAAQVDQAGAKTAAKALWKALSLERPDDEVLKLRAGEGVGSPGYRDMKLDLSR